MEVREESGGRYTPHIVVFFGSACIMVLELVAGRLIARHLGNSLYTWTSVIGVILAGISAGNYVGGRLADRWPHDTLMGLLFLCSSALCLLVLPINRLFSDVALLEGVLWPVRTFVTVLAIFALPAIALGAISPVAAKMAVDRGDAVGNTIGSVYAWGAIGSIVGTFVTGFWIIAVLGAKDVVLVIALCLAVMSICVGRWRWIASVWAVILGVILCVSLLCGPVQGSEAGTILEFLGLRKDSNGLFVADSNYQFICVSEQASQQDSSRTIRKLQLDYLIHGYVDLNDPGYLEYAYEKLYREAVRRYLGSRKTISAFFIGGGSYTFPRWVLNEWPGSTVHVAEIDPLVLEANHRALGLPRNTPIRTYLADARTAVDELPSGVRYDLAVGDAFNDLSVPFHLTTLQFNEKIAGHLSSGGVYLVNVIDDWAVGRLLGAYVSTLQKTFRHVKVLCTDRSGVHDGRQTFVLIASMVPVSSADLQPGHTAELEGSFLTEQDMIVLASKSRGLILTDDYAPVENLLEPVVRKRD